MKERRKKEELKLTPIRSIRDNRAILIPLLLISIVQHVWSLKIKNDSFIMKVEIIRKISANK